MFAVPSSGVTGGGQGGRVPPETSDRENCKREGGKLEMEVGKVIKRGADQTAVETKYLTRFLMKTFKDETTVFGDIYFCASC